MGLNFRRLALKADTLLARGRTGFYGREDCVTRIKRNLRRGLYRDEMVFFKYIYNFLLLLRNYLLPAEISLTSNVVRHTFEHSQYLSEGHKRISASL